VLRFRLLPARTYGVTKRQANCRNTGTGASFVCSAFAVTAHRSNSELDSERHSMIFCIFSH
jgi:hypothetical protein